MRLRLFSDLHLEHYTPSQQFNVGDGDILVLAGDIINTKHLKKNGYLKDLYLQFFNNCSNNYQHILYVKGNHEYYGYNYEGTSNKILEYLPANFHLMENDTITLGDWSFIGFTLWTDFFNEDPIEMWDAQNFMNDYKAIRIGSNYRKLRAGDTLAFNRKSKEYLKTQLETINNNIFVISHHAPSHRSIPERYRTARCNGAYVNNMDELIVEHPQIKYWCHGHTHNTFDYMIGECRVLCNPYGYLGESSNSTFNPDLLIELD